MKAIAFVTRVHPKRSGMLKICIDSIKEQASNDYIHILHEDDKTEDGYGIFLANQSIAKISPINARYVMVLDDDDVLVDPNFVKIFRKIVNKNNPEIVFFKGRVIGQGIYPKKRFWDEAPRRRFIAGFCFAVRLDIWKKHIHKWGKRTCGDYFFISACYKNTKNHIWLDRIVAETQKLAGHGAGEHEHE